MRARWILIAAVGCGARAPAHVVSNHAPSWQQHCAPLLERSVHADARGVDRLVAPVDDDLRTCWRLAVRIVDTGRPVAPPPSCRALRVSELRLSRDWLATCRRFEAGAPPARPIVARSSPLTSGLERPSFVPNPVLRRPFVDADGDGVPDGLDRCPDDGTDGCPRRLGSPLPRLQGLAQQAPAMPPYDLTPAAQAICAAVRDIVDHFASAPTPTIPLALAQTWSADGGKYDVEWPADSTVAPVEDALRACLGEWSLEIVKTHDVRSLRWQRKRFVVELRTTPERRLSIATH